MTKTLMSGVAALAFAFGAANAYAQDSQVTDPEITQSEADAVMDAAEDTLEAAEETMDAAEELQDETVDTDISTDTLFDTDPVDIDADVDMDTPDTMSDMPVDTLSVTCPEGTEAQADGSCMVVGEWDAETVTEEPVETPED